MRPTSTAAIGFSDAAAAIVTSASVMTPRAGASDAAFVGAGGASASSLFILGLLLPQQVLGAQQIVGGHV